MWCPTENLAGKQLLELCAEGNYQIYAPDKPTRLKDRGYDSTLDIFITKNMLLKEVETLTELSSDHFPVSVKTTRKIPIPKKKN